MMKKYTFALLVVFSFVFATAASAQLIFLDDSVTESVAASQEDVSGDIRIVNQGVSSTFRWVRTITELPSDWATAVCDVNQCHLPTVDSAEFVLEAGDTSIMTVHVYRDLDASLGNAQVEVILYDLVAPRDKDTATFFFTEVSNLREVSKQNFKVYPNPAETFFSVSTDAQLEQLFVFDMLGREVLRFDANQESFDISSLNKGLYLVKAVNNQGKVLKAVRLTKE